MRAVGYARAEHQGTGTKQQITVGRPPRAGGHLPSSSAAVEEAFPSMYAGCARKCSVPVVSVYRGEEKDKKNGSDHAGSGRRVVSVVCKWRRACEPPEQPTGRCV